jgi:hypothetical protein
MLCSRGLVISFSIMEGEAPGYMLTTETDGNSIEGNNSCLMDGIIKAPNRSMAIVASATRLRFARLSLARKDMIYSSIHNRLKLQRIYKISVG